MNTLRRWWYEQTKSKSILPENGEDKKTPDPEAICQRCGKNPIAIRGETGKPYSPKSKFFGLCWACSKNIRGAGTPKKEDKNV